MAKAVVIVTRRWPQEAEARLQELFDARLNTDDRPMDEARLQAALREADVVLPTVSDRITAAVLEAPPGKTRILANFGVGFNHIDIKAAKRLGIVVTNTPEVLTDCTADIAMLLLLGAARRGSEGERHLRAGDWTGWRPTHMLGTRVSGKTLGLIGFGRIARAMTKRARLGFDMRIIFHDPYPPPTELAQELQAEARNSVEEVLREADFVSLHCPGGKDTRHLLNRERIAMMKPGAFLINSARGDVIDEAALAAALQNGQLAGAGLDVYEHEPEINADLLSLENVFLLPHLGSASHETRVAMGMRAIDNVQAFLSGQEPPDRVA